MIRPTFAKLVGKTHEFMSGKIRDLSVNCSEIVGKFINNFNMVNGKVSRGTLTRADFLGRGGGVSADQEKLI